jgi:plasmid stability protein
MPTLQIRDLPQNLYELLKNTAEVNRRSMTQEVIHIIDAYLHSDVSEDKLLAKKKALLSLNEKKPHFSDLTKQKIVKMIREDRDK